MILSQIVEEKKKKIEAAKKKLPEKALVENLAAPKYPRKPHLFKHALAKTSKMHLIAEVKKASPSAGVIKEDFDPVKIALLYENNGASAISVLTEEKFFQGHLSHLEKIRKKASLPILRKDFLIDKYQVYESASAGADAILLISDLLSLEELREFQALAKDMGMDCLVEVHSEEDVQKALGSNCDIIGINNRDLHTFKVDVNNTARLIKLIPRDKIIVSESGIRTKENILYLKSLGVDAVVVGEFLMRSEDIGRTIKELLG